MGNLNTSRDWDDEMLDHESSDEDILEQLGPDNEDGYYVVCIAHHCSISGCDSFYCDFPFLHSQAMFLRRMIDR